MHTITDQTRIRFDDRSCVASSDRGPEERRSLNHGHVMTLREFFDVNNEGDENFENDFRDEAVQALTDKGEWLSEEGGIGSQVYLVVQE